MREWIYCLGNLTALKLGQQTAYIAIASCKQHDIASILSNGLDLKGGYVLEWEEEPVNGISLVDLSPRLSGLLLLLLAEKGHLDTPSCALSEGQPCTFGHNQGTFLPPVINSNLNWSVF